MILEFMKTRENAITPRRANPSDAGLDVFFCPENGESVKLQRNENRLFQTGLRFGVPHGYMLQVMNRSGMAAKKSLIVGAHCSSASVSPSNSPALIRAIASSSID